jgi:hypothetical protein
MKSFAEFSTCNIAGATVGMYGSVYCIDGSQLPIPDWGKYSVGSNYRQDLQLTVNGIPLRTDSFCLYTMVVDAGYYENVWVKNCLAIGLAANFIEPLEATSIMQTIRTLISFFNNLNNLHEEDESQKINFNNKIKKDMVETMNFIFLHYITNKKDSEFWDFYRQKKNQPETVKKIMQIIKNDIPSFYDSEIRSIQWGYSAYMSILFGNDLIPHHVYKKYDFYRNKKLYFDERITDIETKKQFLLDHRFFLEEL